MFPKFQKSITKAQIRQLEALNRLPEAQNQEAQILRRETQNWLPEALNQPPPAKNWLQGTQI